MPPLYLSTTSTMAKRKQTKNKSDKKSQRVSQRKKEEEEFIKLQERVAAFDPRTDEKLLGQFSDLPISQETLKGLNGASFMSSWRHL